MLTCSSACMRKPPMCWGTARPLPATTHGCPMRRRSSRRRCGLYPPVWVTARTCSVPYQIAGFEIPVGATLLAPQYAVHRDPRFFTDPRRFDPDRFTPEHKASRPRYSYFPFAGGSRQCIAEGLAWMEGTLVLAVIARDWNLTPPLGSPAAPPINPSISLRPREGVPLRIARR